MGNHCLTLLSGENYRGSTLGCSLISNLGWNFISLETMAPALNSYRISAMIAPSVNDRLEKVLWTMSLIPSFVFILYNVRIEIFSLLVNCRCLMHVLAGFPSLINVS